MDHAGLLAGGVLLALGGVLLIVLPVRPGVGSPGTRLSTSGGPVPGPALARSVP